MLLREQLEQALDGAETGQEPGGALPRPRPLQGGQRHARPSRRRCAAQGRRRAAAQLHRGDRHAWRGSAATSLHRPDRRASSQGRRHDAWQHGLLEAIGEPFELGAIRLTIGTSIGIAVAPGRRHRCRRAAQECGPRPLPGQERRRAAAIASSSRRWTHDMQARRKLELDLRKALRQRRVRALLPAARQPRARRDLRLRGPAALAPSRARVRSRRRSSFRWPRKPGSSCRSANGCCDRPARMRRAGPSTSRSRSTSRPSSSRARNLVDTVFIARSQPPA